MFGLRFFVVVLLALSFGVLPGVGNPPDEAKKDADAVKAVRKAAETAEVHGIAMYRPAIYSLQSQEVKDWPKLVKAIRSGKGAVAHTCQFLPERVSKLANEDGMTERVTQLPEPFEVQLLKGDFIRGFREILEDRDFYDETAFKGVTLDDELKRLIGLGKKRTMHQTALLNWGLMIATFPGSIPDVPPRLRTVRVQVRDDKEVVLVLSCSESCHWEVDVKPGCKVTGVILCGGNAQEVELIENPIKAPVVYRSAHAPDGSRRLAPAKYFDGYELRAGTDKKLEPREKFEAGIKELTGKDKFVSIQRENTPKTEPYIVPPKAK